MVHPHRLLPSHRVGVCLTAPTVLEEGPTRHGAYCLPIINQLQETELWQQSASPSPPRVVSARCQWFTFRSLCSVVTCAHKTPLVPGEGMANVLCVYLSDCASLHDLFKNY